MALASVVHALVLRTAYRSADERSSLERSMSQEHLPPKIKDADQCKPLSAFEEWREAWSAVLPAAPADLWPWCLSQTPERLLDLLAYAAAHSINAVDTGSGYNKVQLDHANDLALALSLDMSRWFAPTAGGGEKPPPVAGDRQPWRQRSHFARLSAVPRAASADAATRELIAPPIAL